MRHVPDGELAGTVKPVVLEHSRSCEARPLAGEDGTADDPALPVPRGKKHQSGQGKGQHVGNSLMVLYVRVDEKLVRIPDTSVKQRHLLATHAEARGYYRSSGI